jgi:hypothetical protein
MSVPASQEPRDGGGRWETIRYALDSTPRTLRYCLMVIASPTAFAAIVELIRHMLLGAAKTLSRSARNPYPGAGAGAADDLMDS